MFRKVDVVRCKEKVKDYVAEDIKFKLIINGKELSFRMSPNLKKEFVIGYCFAEGLIESLDDFEEIRVENGIAYAKINIKKRKLSKIKSNLQVSYDEIVKNMEKLKKFSEIWKKTGGTHICALVADNKFLVVEDINRHACIDKLLGVAVKRNINFSTSYLVCSGRISEERVAKIVRANIPIIATMAAPLSSGIKCAKKYGVTLAGFVRNGKINIYSHPERIRNEV